MEGLEAEADTVVLYRRVLAIANLLTLRNSMLEEEDGAGAMGTQLIELVSWVFSPNTVPCFLSVSLRYCMIFLDAIKTCAFETLSSSHSINF